MCIAVQVKKEKQSRTSECLPICTDSVGIGAIEQAVINVSDERITLMSAKMNARRGRPDGSLLVNSISPVLRLRSESATSMAMGLVTSSLHKD